MKYFYYSILSVLCMVLLVLAISCKAKEAQDNIIFPETPVYTGYINYVISTESYTRLYRMQDIYSEVVSVVRKGDVFILLETKGQDEFGSTWFYVYNNRLSGWLLLQEPFLAYSREKADLLSRKLKEE